MGLAEDIFTSSKPIRPWWDISQPGSVSGSSENLIRWSIACIDLFCELLETYTYMSRHQWPQSSSYFVSMVILSISSWTEVSIEVRDEIISHYLETLFDDDEEEGQSLYDFGFSVAAAVLALLRVKRVEDAMDFFYRIKNVDASFIFLSEELCSAAGELYELLEAGDEQLSEQLVIDFAKDCIEFDEEDDAEAGFPELRAFLGRLVEERKLSKESLVDLLKGLRKSIERGSEAEPDRRSGDKKCVSGLGMIDPYFFQAGMKLLSIGEHLTFSQLVSYSTDILGEMWAHFALAGYYLHCLHGEEPQWDRWERDFQAGFRVGREIYDTGLWFEDPYKAIPSPYVRETSEGNLSRRALRLWGAGHENEALTTLAEIGNDLERSRAVRQLISGFAVEPNERRLEELLGLLGSGENLEPDPSPAFPALVLVERSLSFAWLGRDDRAATEFSAYLDELDMRPQAIFSPERLFSLLHEC